MARHSHQLRRPHTPARGLSLTSGGRRFALILRGVRGEEKRKSVTRAGKLCLGKEKEPGLAFWVPGVEDGYIRVGSRFVELSRWVWNAEKLREGAIISETFQFGLGQILCQNQARLEV